MFKKLIAPAIAALLFGSLCLDNQALGANGAVLRGSVVSSTDRVPLAGVLVDVYSVPSDQSLATALTDKNGTFVVVGLTPGTYRMKLSRSAYDTIVLTGIKVTGNGHMRLKDPLAMQPAGGTAKAATATAQLSACQNLVQPGQTADVYIVCTDKR